MDDLIALMSKLKTIKGKAKLSEYTNFVAIKSNKTSWNGNYRMSKRFLDFKPDIEKYINDPLEMGELQTSVAECMPTASRIIGIKKTSKALKVFHSVSLLLQKKEGHISNLYVSVLFDKLIDD